MGLGKISTKKCAQSHLSSLWRLTWVFERTWKVSTKKCAQSPVSSLCRLSQVFDRTRKNFHKKVCPVTRFFAVETNLSFWCDLESFDKKSVTSYTFLRCGDYLKFLMGLGKIFTKKCAQLHVLFAVETNLGFWWDLEKFSQKKCAQSQVSSLCRLSQVFDGTLKKFHKKVYPVTRFFAVETNLSFWCHLESFDKKSVTSYTFFRCGA